MTIEVLLRLECLGVHFIKGRNSIVPFEQGRRRANAAGGVFIQFPHRIDDGMVVCVENVLAKLGVPRDVDLGHALGRNTV